MQAEMDLDIQHNGKKLTEIYDKYKNNIDIIKVRLRELIAEQCAPGDAG